jgi:hypothetical protein
LSPALLRELAIAALAAPMFVAAWCLAGATLAAMGL